MNVEITAVSKEHSVATLKGRLDLNTADAVRQTLMELVSDGCRELEINCAGLEYLSSYGIRVFLILAKRLQVLKGSVTLRELPPMIYKVMETSGLTGLFTIR